MNFYEHSLEIGVVVQGVNDRVSNLLSVGDRGHLKDSHVDEMFGNDFNDVFSFYAP